MKEKLIVTIWRAQLKQTTNTLPIICRVTYGNQSKRTKAAQVKKALIWKQTFVMPLNNTSNIKLDFIRLQQGQQIHYAGEQVAESLAFGHSVININVQTSSKGTLPAKSDIVDDDGNCIGKIFIEYEVLKTEITYIVQKQMDYLYMMKVSNFKVTFLRKLKKIPNFYLRLKLGDKDHKEDFAFNEEDGVFTYNYPVKIHIKRESEIEIQLEVRDLQGSDYGQNDDKSYQTNSITSQRGTQKSIGKKNPIDLTYDRVVAIMDLTFKKNVNIIKKLPLTVAVRNGKREIGTIEFQIETFFKSKQELDELEEQLKGEKEIEIKPIQKKKKYQPPKNGIITVNSIIAKMEPFNEQALEGKDFSLQIKLGKQIQFSSILQSPGKQLIFIDTYNFRRTWEQTMKFTINIHSSQGQRLPSFYSQINLRELWDIRRIMAKRIPIKDEFKNYCGEIIIDILYNEQQKKKDLNLSVTKQSVPQKQQKNQEQIKQEKKQLKRLQIIERMKIKQLQKEEHRKKIFDMESVIPHFSEHQLLLPPLRHKQQSPTSFGSKKTLSPKTNAYIYNRGGSIMFSKSPRFMNDSNQHPGSYFSKRQSDFDYKNQYKGPFIGYGDKSDFTKIPQQYPGVGRYQIPSVWDKYK